MSKKNNILIIILFFSPGFSIAQNFSYQTQGNDAIITFDHSSSSEFPGISGVFYNGSGTYSDVIEVKKGDTIVNSASSTTRWGDYTGSQTKYNA